MPNPFVQRLRRLLAMPDQLDNLKETVMAGTDRDLYAAIVTGLQALGPAFDNLAADRDGWRSRALAAEGREATDEAEDVAAVQPAKDLVDALMQKVSPAAPQDQAPVASPEEAIQVVQDAPEPAPVDGDQPA